MFVSVSMQDPNLFAISVCTVDGQRFDIGDTNATFTMQSCVQPVAYAVALECVGEAEVHGHVGCEPSGAAFNDISLNDAGLPHNPVRPMMLAAGSCCSLLSG